MNTKKVSIGKGAVTFQNSMMGELRYNVLSGRYAKEDKYPDARLRDDFAFIVGHVKSVEKLEWEPVDQAASEAEFNASYEAFMDMTSRDEYVEVIGAVHQLLRSTANDVEKPDRDLTPEEAADPN